jgi:ceramide glucosyltransferase
MLTNIVLGISIYLFFSTTIYQLITLTLLCRHLSRKRKLAKATMKASSFPGISVLIPVKGIYPTFGENLRTILEQNYPGPLEVILGVKSENDPVLEFSRKVASSLGSKVKLQFAVGGKDAGLNPKNSNLCRAFPKARHDWIYCSDADVALEPSFFTNAIALLDENKYASTFNMFRGAPNLGAMVEAVGTNTEASAFFLLTSLMPKKGVMNGASMFFHRKLIAKVGGIQVAVNQITDDLYLAGQFNKVGAEFVLLPNNVIEHIPAQNFSAFWNRVVRWLLITRCNRPSLFWMAPTSWVWQWCLVNALVFRDHRLWLVFAAGAVGRLIFSLIFHTSLAGCREWWKIIVLPVYDACGPVAWTVSLFQKRITWAGNLMIVTSTGELEKI